MGSSWGCRPGAGFGSGVTGFSLSGLFSQASCLKLWGLTSRPGGMVDGKFFLPKTNFERNQKSLIERLWKISFPSSFYFELGQWNSSFVHRWLVFLSSPQLGCGPEVGCIEGFFWGGQNVLSSFPPRSVEFQGKRKKKTQYQDNQHRRFTVSRN